MGESKISELDDQILWDLRPAIFHVVIRHRNAWHSTPVSHHRSDTTVAGSFYHAARVAESWRAAGSSFTIRQVPGLSITSRPADMGVGRNYFVVDLNADRPLSTWKPRSSDFLTRGEPVRYLLSSLVEGGDHDFPGPEADSLIVARPQDERFGIHEDDSDVPDLYISGRILKVWQSSAPSHTEPLQWSEIAPTHVYDLSKILEIDDLYRQANDLGPRDGAFDFRPGRQMPLGEVVAGFVVLRRDDGSFFVYSSTHSRSNPRITMPEDSVRADLHDAITRAVTEANG